MKAMSKCKHSWQIVVYPVYAGIGISQPIVNHQLIAACTKCLSVEWNVFKKKKGTV